MTKSTTRWVLAFDASCGTCQTIADTVARVCADKLEVLPLVQADVRRWREQSLGARAPWQPTLIRVDGDDTRAWMGRRLVLPLVQRLGVRPTIRLLRALGDLRLSTQSTTADRSRGMGRQQVLRLGAGLVVAGGLVLTGRTAATAASRTPGEVLTWVEANRDRLPKTYAELAAYSVDYRKAIYREHGPQVRSALWTAHVEQYRAAHPGLTASQNAVIDKALDVARQTQLFGRGYATAQDAPHSLVDLKDAAIAELGNEQARALLSILGPADATAALVECDCSTADNWCGPWPCAPAYCYTSYSRCQCQEDGCGIFWQYSCNGRCEY